MRIFVKTPLNTFIKAVNCYCRFRFHLHVMMICVCATLLCGCTQRPTLPYWSTQTQPTLQAKQVNRPDSGQNYVLCAQCVHITPLTMRSHRYHQQKRRHT